MVVRQMEPYKLLAAVGFFFVTVGSAILVYTFALDRVEQACYYCKHVAYGNLFIATIFFVVSRALRAWSLRRRNVLNHPMQTMNPGQQPPGYPTIQPGMFPNNQYPPISTQYPSQFAQNPPVPGQFAQPFQPQSPFSAVHGQPPPTYENAMASNIQ